MLDTGVRGGGVHRLLDGAAQVARLLAELPL
jgi:hypothetical protein